MKKIVGILTAAAIATSVFAADISAKVQLEGNLFKYNTDGSMSALDIAKPGAQSWNPIFNVSVNGDNAGAEFCVATGDFMGKIAYWQKGYDTYASNFKIWMSPIDGLKLTFGHNGFNLNQEHINYSKSDSGLDELFGYSLGFAKDGLSFDVMLVNPIDDSKVDNAPSSYKMTINPWMSMGTDNKVIIRDTAFKFQYGADFGTVNAILVAKDTFKDLKFGAAYANNFSGVNMFLNVLGYMSNSKFNKLRAELYGEGNVDALAWKLFPVIEFSPDAADKVEALIYARVDYALDGFGIYLYVEDEGLTKIMNGKPLVIKPGFKGNIGAASWDVAFKIDVDKKTAFSVPVVFSYAW